MTLQLLTLTFHLTRYNFFCGCSIYSPLSHLSYVRRATSLKQRQTCTNRMSKKKKIILIFDCNCSSHKQYMTFSCSNINLQIQQSKLLSLLILRDHLTPQVYGPSRPSFIFFVNHPYLRLVSGFLPPVSKRMSRSEAILISC